MKTKMRVNFTRIYNFQQSLRSHARLFAQVVAVAQRLEE